MIYGVLWEDLWEEKEVKILSSVLFFSDSLTLYIKIPNGV